jgi:hypothetical protein
MECQFSAILEGEFLDMAIMADDPSRLITELVYSTEDGVVRFTTADGKRWITFLEYFEPNAVTEPDFTNPKILDCGQTIAFGDYEASVDVVLDNSLRFIGP